MTDEERQRQIDFILDSLARLTAASSQLAEAQARDRAAQSRDRARLARLEESFVVLTELASRHEERLDAGDARAANLEAAVAELRRLSAGDS